MGNLWWLEPGWGDACCAQCGTNIKATGGDPDWGYCYDCFSERVEMARREKARRADRAEGGEEMSKLGERCKAHGIVIQYCALCTSGAAASARKRERRDELAALTAERDRLREAIDNTILTLQSRQVGDWEARSQAFYLLTVALTDKP